MKEVAQRRVIYTIGHSTHELDDFVALLTMNGINAIADVRSVPHSRWQPQFNRGALRTALRQRNIAYAFLGRELGARSDDPDCYKDGRVQYRLLAGTRLFRSGLKRVLQGSGRHTIALMCAEKEPLDCHRTILVARALAEKGVAVAHILPDGQTESHDETMDRLSRDLGLENGDLFDPPEQIRARAYRMQEERIAYARESTNVQGTERK